MWAFWVLFWLFFAMDSCAVRIEDMSVNHGSPLSFRLPKEVKSLFFSSADNQERYLIWPSRDKRRGQVNTFGSDKQFTISSAIFDDQGNYTQKNLNNKMVTIVKVKVSPLVMTMERVAGETLKIPLQGLTSDQATLHFYSQDLNLTLVDHGSPVGKNHIDYYDRLQVTTGSIQVLTVNVSDVGKYILRDHKSRVVCLVNMTLVDHHPTSHWNPLTAFILLLGIPAAICCCCKNRIFKKSSPSTNMTTVLSGNLNPPPGPPPSYNTVMVPAVPGPINPPVYPVSGDSKDYPPPNPAFAPQPYYGGQPAIPLNPGASSEYSPGNPVYPPTAPGFPPAQPPQWSATSYNPPAPAVRSIPAAICCCCKNRIFKKSSPSTNMTTVLSGNLNPPPGPPPSYNTVMVPAVPGPINPPVYPVSGDSKDYPPPNPAFAPQPYYGGQPAIPLNPLPQLNATSYNPPVPAGLAPVTCHVPTGPSPDTGEINMNEISTATPLLTPSQTEVRQPPGSYACTDVLNSDSAVQFNINTGKETSSNFL